MTTFNVLLGSSAMYVTPAVAVNLSCFCRCCICFLVFVLSGSASCCHAAHPLAVADCSTPFCALASVIRASGGALAFFASTILERRSKWFEEVEDQVESKRKQRLETWVEWAKTHKTSVITFSCFSIWLAAGIIFGVVHSGWSFITSVYFSIAAMSTAGLQV